MSPWRIKQIANQINHGAVIAYPTDTIWGLGCHPLDLNAVRRIQSIKQRSLKKGLILLSSSIDFFTGYIDKKILEKLAESISHKSPRPVTWVVEASNQCPSWLTADTKTIAVRITDKPLIQQLCESTKSPLVSTSANISGRPPARNSWLIHKNFQHQVDFVIEGFARSNTANLASEIRDLQSGKTLRS